MKRHDFTMLCENVRHSQHILIHGKVIHPGLYDLKNIFSDFSFDKFSNSVNVLK